MISDESSSDSETGRFKCRTKNEEQTKTTRQEDNSRSLGRSRPPEKERFFRDFGRSREVRERFERRSRERQRFGRHSPVRRRHSRERSRHKSREHEKPRSRGDSRPRSRPRGHRSNSREKSGHSRSMSHRSPEQRRDLKEEIKRNLKDEVKRNLKDEGKSTTLKDEVKRNLKETIKPPVPVKEKSVEKSVKKLRDRSPSPEEKKVKRSEIHKPTPSQRKKSISPVALEGHESDGLEVVQSGSYYSMIPAVVKEKEEEVKKAPVNKEKSEESSEIDSSDDERLRAKLLNLEKELHKTRKKKHKKKHKKKSSKSIKDMDRDSSTVEVTSTTDIDKAHVPNAQSETVEVTSTQKSNQKESSEEGEISSDDDSQERFDIDPTDLRHKLKRSRVATSKETVLSKAETCGPALPPHLQKKSERSKSREIEGPALPPHLQSKPKNIGPSIPENMRKVLAERDHDHIKYVSSDEDDGIGPLPAGAEEKWSDAHKRLEERALDMKIKKLDGHSMQKSDVKSREQWMLELPEGKAKILGLEARSFRAKAGPDMSDRSSWTDTPEEKARKAAGIKKEEDPDIALQQESRARHISSRDDEQERAVKKHKKKHKRDESLLELHQKKLKKKKKKDDKDEEKPERRPFSRDLDLQVNRFDEAQKKSIIKKAQGLNTRFSRGEAKYL